MLREGVGLGQVHSPGLSVAQIQMAERKRKRAEEEARKPLMVTRHIVRQRGESVRRRFVRGHRDYLRMEHVLKTVSEVSGVSEEALLGTRRGFDISRPRMIAMALIRKHCPGKSSPEIGEFMNKDHSTILTAVDRVDKLRRQHPDIDDLYRACELALDN